jgi:hypothetical protein
MKACSIIDCDKEPKTRGYCRKHYYEWLKTADRSIIKKRKPIKGSLKMVM